MKLVKNKNGIFLAQEVLSQIIGVEQIDAELNGVEQAIKNLEQRKAEIVKLKEEYQKLEKE
jgi:hypothetical protein